MLQALSSLSWPPLFNAQSLLPTTAARREAASSPVVALVRLGELSGGGGSDFSRQFVTEVQSV